MTTLAEVHNKLTGVFGASDIYCRPGMVMRDKTKATILTYLDATAVMSRLDEAVGPDAWSEDSTVIVYPDRQLVQTGGEIIFAPRAVVKCSLTVLGVTRTGIGEGGPESEPYKSAASDALKRAAWLFGIGAYLRRLPKLWWPLKDGKWLMGNEEELCRLMHAMSAELVENGTVDMARYRKAAELAGEDKHFCGDSGPAASMAGSQPAPAPVPAETPKSAPQTQPQGQVPGTEAPACEGCGGAIKGYETKAGKTYTAEQMVGFSRKDCDGKVLCYKCKQAYKDGSLVMGSPAEVDPFAEE